jgi:hypothetical protein
MLTFLLHLLFATFGVLFGQAADAAPVPAPAPVTMHAPVPVSTIGGTPVPDGLDCEEDEVIFFTGVDTIGCVHPDNL